MSTLCGGTAIIMFTSSSSSFSVLSSASASPATPSRLPNKSHPAGTSTTTTRRLLLQTLTASMVAFCLIWAAKAGILSGYPGIESVPGPDLPSIEFLNKWNDENQKLYTENDKRFKDSPILKKLLEQSKLNKDKNKQLVADKYCLRGAEWGVGDCSAEGMTPDERDKFIAMLKQKVGEKD
ncbi:uncharacterized protein LOC124925282 [Impatiens glandulifera]|uniref:uncharacterized protein LOC124925282 n=1 Tax=Impatiens glandulifera TaxID=253017 RepID=UPI001FB07B32|nr:uncharacterized protein LOC124925282 [Impatiens glandulifera]